MTKGVSGGVTVYQVLTFYEGMYSENAAKLRIKVIPKND